MATTAALQNPTTRDALIEAMQRGSYIPGQEVTGAPSAGSGANSDNPSDIDIAGEQKRIADFGEVQRQTGYKQVEESARRRGVLRSGVPVVGDQLVAEQARVQSEAQLIQSRNELLKLRLDQRSLELQEKEQSQASAARASELGTTIKEQSEASTARTSTVTSESGLRGAQASAVGVEAEISRKRQIAEEGLGMRAAATAEARAAIESRYAGIADRAQTETENARIQQDIMSREKLAGRVRDPRSGEIVDTIDQKVLTEQTNARVANLLEVARQTDMTDKTSRDNLAAELANRVSLGTMSQQSAKDIAMIEAKTQSRGYDITTTQGAKDFRDYIDKVANTFNLTATDQKNLEINKLASTSGGYDLSTQTGRDDYKKWLDSQRSTYELTAATQSAVAKAQIAYQAAGFDLTNPAERTQYTAYLKANQKDYNLSAEDLRQQFTWNYWEQSRQFNMADSTDREKFFEGLREGAREFDLSATDQMSMARAKILSDENITKLGINAQMLVNLTEIAASQNAVMLGSGPLSDSRQMINAMIKTDWVFDTKYGTQLPSSAVEADANGVAPVDRASFLFGTKTPSYQQAHDMYKKVGSLVEKSATRGDANYDPKYDFDRNGKIDFEDVFIVAALFPKAK